jgi:hypothetical protein
LCVNGYEHVREDLLHGARTNVQYLNRFILHTFFYVKYAQFVIGLQQHTPAFYLAII